MIILFILLFSGVPLISTSERWVTKMQEKECFECTRYERTTSNFSSLLPLNSDKIILGGKNAIYKIEFEKTKVVPYLDGSPPDKQDDVEKCKQRGRSEIDCQNYYKVLVMISDNELMSCGTSAFQPMCDIRTISDLRFKSRNHLITGESICPSDPNVPTSVMVLQSDTTVGFSATCVDECTDYQISRLNLLPGSLSSTGKTVKTTDWLNSPTFIYSFEEADYVYFIFYETAIEVKSEKVYSRIARICKNDVGSSQGLFNKYFLSYSKARIYCTSNKPGQAPFNHDEVGGAYYKDQVLYAVFSGQRNLRTGSILCSYTIDEIDAAFAGPYLFYDSDLRQWAEKENKPFSCSNKKTIQESMTLTLMKKSIYQNQPLYYTTTEMRLISIAVVSKKVEESDFTIIYTGSESGEVVRVGLLAGLTGNPQASVIKAGPSGPVTSLTLSSAADVLFAVSPKWVTKIPTRLDGGCRFATTCNECISVYYPYCSWCKQNGAMRCVVGQNECDVRDLVLPTDTCLPLPIFNTLPSDISVTRGGVARFQCQSRDNEEPQWSRKDGGSVSRRAQVKDGWLTFPRVELQDMGCYVCSLNNTSGRVQADGCLSVTERPFFIQEPENVSALEEDTNIELKCQATGSPLPKINWFKEEGKMPEGIEVTEQGYLRIYRVLDVDEGNYRCTAKNSQGSITSKAGFLKVIGGSINALEDPGNGNSFGSMPSVSIVGLVVSIVVCAVLCFAVGLIVHKLYRRHRKKREADMPATPHVYDGRVHTRGQWTPINTLPYQMCHAEEWRDSGMFSCTFPPTPAQNPPPLPLRPDQLNGDLLEEDEAPPAYDDRDSPPLLPPTPVSLGAPACFPPPSCSGGRYTPTGGYHTCPQNYPNHYCSAGPHMHHHTPHYATLSSDYATITPNVASPQIQPYRQYSMDLNVHNAQRNAAVAPITAAQHVNNNSPGSGHSPGINSTHSFNQLI